MGPFRRAPGPMDMGFMNFEPPSFPQPSVPAPGQEEQPWYGDRSTASMMLAALSNGLGGMTLRGKSGMSGINNAVFASGAKQSKRNRSMDYLKENNPKLHETLIGLPEEVRDLYMGEAFKAMFKQPDDRFKTLDANDKEKVGLPADGNFKMNMVTGEISAIGNGGVSIKMPNQAGAPPPGWRNVYDEQGNLVTQEIIPGGVADLEQQEAAAKEGDRATQKGNAASTVVTDLERSVELVDEGNASDIFGDTGSSWFGELLDVAEGLTAIGLSTIPGGRTDASQALQLSESARSNIGIDSLQTMRENSPTGGALGQVPFQQQKRLEQLYGQLNPVEMAPEEYIFNANRVINLYTDIIYGNSAERAKLVEQGVINEQQNREIEGRYKVLNRDASGRKFDVSNPPPDWPYSPAEWAKQPEQNRLQMWNRYEREAAPRWYSQ
jgi:hypothetical protein